MRRDFENAIPEQDGAIRKKHVRRRNFMNGSPGTVRISDTGVIVGGGISRFVSNT